MVSGTPSFWFGLTDHRFARVGPLIRICQMVIVIGDELVDALGQRCRRAELSTPQESPAEDAEPDFDLIHPTAMFGGEVDHVLVAGIGQIGTALRAGPQGRALLPGSRPLSH